MNSSDQRVVARVRRRVRRGGVRASAATLLAAAAGLVAADAGRSAAATPPGSASRAGCPGCPSPASAWPPRAAPPGPRPRRRRSRRTGGRARRGPAAPARAAGPRRRGVVHAVAALSTRSRSSAGRSITWRTSIGCCDRHARRARARPRACAAISIARSSRLDVDDPVAGQQLLGLRERAVGDHRRADAVGRDDLGQLGPGQALRRRPARRSPRSARQLSRAWNSMWAWSCRAGPTRSSAVTTAARRRSACSSRNLVIAGHRMPSRDPRPPSAAWSRSRATWPSPVSR